MTEAEVKEHLSDFDVFNYEVLPYTLNEKEGTAYYIYVQKDNDKVVCSFFITDDEKVSFSRWKELALDRTKIKLQDRFNG